MFDFANILFAGPCSARCYFCIGQQLDPRLNAPNLERYPPLGLDAFTAMVWEHQIPQVVLTGTITDPQCYRHEARLLARLRRDLPAATQFSLHTNGRLALRKLDVFNQYDRVTLSFPSFDPLVYRQMMGVPNPPDLAAILQKAAIPIKVSCLVDDHNANQLAQFLAHCQEIGVRRVVLRKLYGERRIWSALLPAALNWKQQGDYRGNPIFDFSGMQVTLWDFCNTESTSLNLFADGTISTRYLLAEAQPLAAAAPVR